MNLNDQKIGAILLKGDYITESDLKKADDYAAVNQVSIIDYLITEQLNSFDLLGQALAEFFKVPYADLNSNIPPAAQVLKIPENIARKHRLVLFSQEAKSVIIASDDPTNKEILIVNLFFVSAILTKETAILLYPLFYLLCQSPEIRIYNGDTNKI